MCVCWSLLRKLNQFALNGLRTVKIVQNPWPAGAALHVLFVFLGACETCACHPTTTNPYGRSRPREHVCRGARQVR
jgi:hypothetical protein